MENNEKLNPTEGTDSVQSYTEVEPFDFEKARRAKALSAKKLEALDRGVEPFDTNKALEYYRPDDLTNNLERLKKYVSELESDYYYSGANTLEEWAAEREKYDINKDSTGHD